MSLASAERHSTVQRHEWLTIQSGKALGPSQLKRTERLPTSGNPSKA